MVLILLADRDKHDFEGDFIVGLGVCINAKSPGISPGLFASPWSDQNPMDARARARTLDGKMPR